MGKLGFEKALIPISIFLFLMAVITLVMMPFRFSEEQPKVGEKSSDVLARLGPPGAIHKPGLESVVQGEPWFEGGNDQKLTPDDLPSVTGERWFYSTGFGGTLHLLVYVDNGVVSRVFWHGT